MACSKYQYVKKFEQTNVALPQTYIVARIDGRAFTKFCTLHKFQKPNDLRAINLMNRAAEHVCITFKDIFLAYGQSDQYSFALAKQSTLFSRRTDKISSCIVSAFSSAYVFYWPQYFPQTRLLQIPIFDSRTVLYPNFQCLKDYFRWRQVDCHINNLYNTVFWLMVKKGKSNTQVEKNLKDTNSGQKNQILFMEFGVNYSKIEEVYRRGTFWGYRMIEKEKKKKENNGGSEIEQEKNKINQDKQNQKISQHYQQLIKKQYNQKQVEQVTEIIQKIKFSKPKLKKKLIQMHEDCIKEQFWQYIVMN